MQEFIDFLSTAERRTVDSDEEDEFEKRHGINADCPIFPGLFEFCRIYAGASVGAFLHVNLQGGCQVLVVSVTSLQNLEDLCAAKFPTCHISPCW
jgi:acetoin utilization deacetylase AcuC-like enzyme